MNPATGVLDVVEAELRRGGAGRLIEELLAFQIQHSCRAWVVELHPDHQEPVRREMIRCASRRGVTIPLRLRSPTAHRAAGVAAVRPLLASGLIRIGANQEVLAGQLRHAGRPGHPDAAPHAVHLLWQLASHGVGRPGGV